jgi:hypothetical protein
MLKKNKNESTIICVLYYSNPLIKFCLLVEDHMVLTIKQLEVLL